MQELFALADLFEAAKHEPEAPQVAQSYAAFKRETVAQFRQMQADGILVEAWLVDGQPYAFSEAMREDVRDYHHLYVFTGGDMPANHPLAEAAFVVDGITFTYNDLFRAVHDYYGHAQTGASFGPKGELQAWNAHAKMYSAEARPAMTAETKMQNAWVNFGRHIRRADGSLPKPSEADYIHPSERPYAEQKAFCAPAHACIPA